MRSESFFMRYLLISLPLAALLAACSPTAPSSPQEPKAANSAPTNAALGSTQWYAWVDRVLHISDDGHGPDPGSTEWNNAVQEQLGQEAPQAPIGSPQWQQAVDALLRTRTAPAS
jgi:hypothetical protein